MIKIKLLFSLMLLAFAVILVAGAHYEKEISGINAFNITDEKLIEPMLGKIQNLSLAKMPAYQCTIEKPEQKIIILRVDDIGIGRKEAAMRTIVETTIERDLPVSLGVIPSDLDEDKSLVRWLNKLKDNPNVEIAQHGLAHTENEFMTLSRAEASAKILKGKELIFKHLKVVPITFIPPYNEYSDETLIALQENNFYIHSSGKETQTFSNNFVVLGYTARTYEFNENRFVPFSETLTDCEKSLNSGNICVVMIHPQDYTNEDSSYVDEKLYNEFINLLDSLEGFNAEFKTFEQLAECTVLSK